MKDLNIMELVNEAKEIANRNFCCKHSNYTVGAVLVTSDGTIFKGFDVENHGILSICAERVAFVKALSEGYSEFKCVVVVGKDMKDSLFKKTLPCGYCRQFMIEYATKDLVIYSYDDYEEKLYEYTLGELLPESYELVENE